MLCFGIFWFVFAVGLRIHVNKLMNSKKVNIFLMNDYILKLKVDYFYLNLERISRNKK